MRKLIKIENDCYFICQRLKEVDPSYEIYFNIDASAYEVHSNEQVRDSFCFKVPYDQLDDRTIEFAFKTKVANMENIIKEIEQNNQLLYDRAVKESADMLREALC